MGKKLVPIKSTTETLSNCHLANYQKDDFYLNWKIEKTNQISAKGLIVPHHLLARQLLEKAYTQINNEKITTVILLGPNHYQAGFTPILLSKKCWETNFGQIEPDVAKINQLTLDGLVKIDEEPFKKEHAVFNHLPYIKKAFPQAKIIPIILMPKISENSAENLASQLIKITDQNTIAIASLDFSHSKPLKETEDNDRQSIDAVRNFKLDKIYALAVDSPPTLYTLMAWLQKQNISDFQLLDNTNSARIGNHLEATDITSYITGYFD
jgi:AmmeMemoRadiSam system protein B